MRTELRTGSLLAAAALAACAAACSTDDPIEPTFEAVFERVIAPSCTFSSCHAAPTNAAKLDLSLEAMCGALIEQPACLFPDRMRIMPGSPEDSFFFHKLTGEGLHEKPTGDCGGTTTNLPMPYGAKGLTDADLALVHGWIAAGAQCTPSKPPEVPAGPAIASVEVSKTVPLAGETIDFIVKLDRPAAQDQTVYIEMDTDALAAPQQITVSATEDSRRFSAYADRPTSRFVVRVRTGGSSKEVMLRIGGVEVAEVLADPAGPDDGLQWIKLHNTSAVPINLSGYQLKAGQGNYDAITVSLTGTIAPGACAVIGGPVQSGANSEPVYAQIENFSPDLPHAGGQAAGFSVFDTRAARVGGVATPVDTMLVGTNNNAQLRGPDAEIASPFCTTPAEGTSALRDGAGSCVQAAMQPRTCP